MKIRFFLDDINHKVRIRGKIRELVKKISEEEDRKIKEVNVIVTSDEKLSSINKEFLKRNYKTDVISFTYHDDPITGEIYISIDSVQENAMKYGQETDRELARVMIHGILHLMGYNDYTGEEKKGMRLLEEKYLSWF